MGAPKETRLSPRTRIEAQIVFKIPSEEAGHDFFSYYSENLSEGGVFLRMAGQDIPFKVGMVLDLHFQLPSSPEMIRTKGKVIWTTEGWSEDLEGVNGIGIQFIDMRLESREVIRRFVRDNFDK